MKSRGGLSFRVGHLSQVKQQFGPLRKQCKWNGFVWSIAQKSKIFHRDSTCFQKKVLAKEGFEGEQLGGGQNKNFFQVKNRTQKTVKK